MNLTWWSYTLLLNAYKYINKSQQNYFFHIRLSRWIWVYFSLLLRHVVCQLTSRKMKCTLSAGHYILYTTWHTKPTKDTLITKLVRKLEAFKLDGIIVPYWQKWVNAHVLQDTEYFSNFSIFSVELSRLKVNYWKCQVTIFQILLRSGLFGQLKLL